MHVTIWVASGKVRDAVNGGGKVGRSKPRPYHTGVRKEMMGVLLRMRWLVIGSICIVVLSLVSCGVGGGQNGTTMAGDGGVRKQPTMIDSTVTDGTTMSTISFRVDGAVSGGYTLSSSMTTSKLRHGHREFTI